MVLHVIFLFYTTSFLLFLDMLFLKFVSLGVSTLLLAPMMAKGLLQIDNTRFSDAIREAAGRADGKKMQLRVFRR